MYNDKLREVTPVRIWENPKNGKVNLTAVDSEGTEKNYTLDKFAEPVDTKIEQTTIDDIVNMPQEELDDLVDALWPAPTPDLARVIATGPQPIDTKGSTAVGRISYDADAKKLFIQFKSKDGKGGGIYQYNDVGQDFADRISKTDSIGKMIPELKKDYSSEKIDEFPEVKIPGAPEVVTPEVAPEVVSEFDENLFDSVFETPDGAYKPNIYGEYAPTGRTTQDSADYTDDPNLLSTKFSAEELARALTEAVLAVGNDPATGKGNLPFESGDEPVAAEALIEALNSAGINGDVVLAGIYDSQLDPDRGETNVERLLQSRESIPSAPEKGQPALAQTQDARRQAIDKATALNGELAVPLRTQHVVTEMAKFEEKNPKITQLADELKQLQDSNAVYDEVAFSDALDKYLPLSTSADPNDREAFKALWGMFMSLDGGSSSEEEFVAPGSFRNLVVEGIKRQLGGADDTTALDAYDELVNNYGGVPEFVENKRAIADGKADLEDGSTGAAFFRLVKAAARPNESPLWRSIGVRGDDPTKDTYITPGSSFSIDPRSFTSGSLETSTLADAAYSPTDPEVDRVIFKIDAGNGSSVSAEGISWFPEEREHFAYGTYEVQNVTRKKSLIPGRQDDYVVSIKQTENVPEEVSEAAKGKFTGLTDYGDISGWERTGGQTGSNAGGFYEDAEGNSYYAKVARSQSHADNEMLASAFYKEFGIKASEVGYGTRNGTLQVITPLIPGASSDIADDIYIGNKKVINQLRDGFAVDAWLANYDVLGAVNDNVVTDENGDAVRLDPGGALMWRARGGPKEWWSDTVDEIDTMRDEDWNETAAAVFSGMSDEEIKKSARFVAEISPSRIDEMVDSVITDATDAEKLKERLKLRREDLMNRLGIEPPVEVLDKPVSLREAMGYPAQDLVENDVSIGDSFTIERVFHDESTPKGKVSIQGYYPGHESQRKEWNQNTVIDVVRGGVVPPKGDKPALHRPKAPYEPSPPAFTGSISKDLAGAATWSEVQDVLNGKDLIFFDYETTGFPDKETGEVNTNKPVQLGAVRVRNGEIVDRFNVFMNPGENLGTWSRNNLKDGEGNSLTDDWLSTQTSLEQAHTDFVNWIGEDAILGGHNVPFDRGVLEKALAGANIDYTPGGYVDTLRLARDLVQKKTKKSPEGTTSHKLGDLTEYYGISLEGWHTADADAQAASELLNALVADAAGRPDADVSALNLNEQNTKYQEALTQFQATKDEYADSLAKYEIDKAIAAAWDCNSGGSGITSAGEESNICSVPSIDQLVSYATPQAQDFIDPDGVDSGSVLAPASYTDNGDEVPEFDGIDTRPDAEKPKTNWPPLDDPDDAFTPTAQQQAVFESVFAGDNVVIRAAAGAGKTSTLVTLAKRIAKYFPNKRIAYIAFNTSVANEGRKKMPGNVEVRTADSIAHGFIKQNMPDLFNKFKNQAALYGPDDIVAHLNVPAIQYTNDEGSRVTMPPRAVVRILRGALYNFSISDDKTLLPKHFDLPTEDITPELLESAGKWWNDIMDPNGKMPFGFAQMKKIWSLSDPDFSSTSSGLKEPVDFVFLDEAQDTNDVLGSVVRDQPDQVQKVIVGDENQAIYSFMGATNWLDRAEVDTDLPLTQSWRFNQVIANAANKFLIFKEQYLDQPMKFVVEGGGPEGQVVPRGSMTDADIVLVRSNAGAFTEVLAELELGKTVGVTKSFKDDMVNFVSAVEWLQGDAATRGKRPAKMPDELKEFKSWKEVLDAADDENSELSRKTNILVDMVENEGIPGLNEIIKKLKTIKGAGDTKDIKTEVDRAELPSTFEDGDSGPLVGDVKYEVDGNKVVLRGSTFNVKDKIKSAGSSVVKYDPDVKGWVVAGNTNEEKAKNLAKLQDVIAGPEAPEQGGAVDVIVSTVHQAKGLEYPKVRIGGDFRGPYQDKQGRWIYPTVEEINIAYVAVTRPESSIDMGSLDWINKFVSDKRVDEAMEKLSIASKKPEEATPAPPLDITDEPAFPPPTVLPEIVDEVADTPESVDEDPIGEAPMPEPSTQEAPSPAEEGAIGIDKAADLNLAFDSTLDWAGQITDPEAEGDMKMKPSATKKAREIADEISNIRSLLASGEITEDQALAQLNALLDSLPEYEGATNDQANLWTLVQEIQDIRNILDGTFYQRPTGKGLPPIDAVDSKGRPVGYSRDGVFLTPGKRVRDKWGYAGTVEAFNEGDWINVYVRYDIDPRDPEKVKKGNWGPGVARVSKNPTTLTVLDPSDDQPWIDTGKVPENKKPKRLDEQIAALKSGTSGKGEKGGGLPKVSAPEGATEAPEAKEVLTTEELKRIQDQVDPKFLDPKKTPQVFDGDELISAKELMNLPAENTYDLPLLHPESAEYLDNERQKNAYGMNQRVREEGVFTPIIVREWKDGQRSIFDGHHRLIAAYDNHPDFQVPVVIEKVDANLGEEFLYVPTYLDNVPGPSERPINNRVEDLEVVTPKSAKSGIWAHYTTQESAQNILTNGIGLPVFESNDAGLGGRRGFPEGTFFVGLNGYDFMEYMASEWEEMHPGEERAVVTVGIPKDLKIISVPRNPNVIDLIDAGIPNELALRYGFYLSEAKNEKLMFPTNVASARIAYDAGFEAIIWNQHEMAILPSAKDREEVQKALVLQSDKKEIPVVVENPTPEQLLGQDEMKTWAEQIKEIKQATPKEIAEFEEKFVEDYTATGVGPTAFDPFDDPVRYYQSNGYRAVNAILREDTDWLDVDKGGYEDPTDDVEKAYEYITELDIIMNNVPYTPEDLVVYRGINPSNIKMLELLDGLEVGSVFQDPGFVSTSMDKDRAEFFSTDDGRILEIVVPAGYKGLMTNSYLQGKSNAWAQEKEWILDRGTSFEVISKDDEKVVVVVTNQVANSDKSKPVKPKSEDDQSSWRDAEITREATVKGGRLYVARGLSDEDIEAMKNGTLQPPSDMLPFFIPMSPETTENDGDGYFFSSSGKRYWGRYGGAGALLVRKNALDEPVYLLAKRSDWISGGGGTWAYPGGAHASIANMTFPISTAKAELAEELGIAIPSNMTANWSIFRDDVEEDWQYSTVIIAEPSSGFSKPVISDNETSAFGWFTADEIRKMKEQGTLHPAFAKVLEDILNKPIAIPQKAAVPKEQYEDLYGITADQLDALVTELVNFFEMYKNGEIKITEMRGFVYDALKAVPKDRQEERDLLLKQLLEYANKALGHNQYLTSDNYYNIFNEMITTTLEENPGEPMLRGSAIVDGVLIEPTGAPKREVENPLPISESGFAGIASLGTAIELIRSGTANFDRSPTSVVSVPTAIDSADIEDLEVRVLHVVTPDGENKLRLKFKLTAWSGVALAKKIEKGIKKGKPLGWNKSDVSLRKSRVDTDTGKLILSNLPHDPDARDRDPNYPVFNAGVTYTLDPDDTITPDTSPRIEFIRSTDAADSLYGGASRSGGKPYAFHNLVTIDLPMNATEQDVIDALKLAGVRDVRSADRVDADLLIENKLLSLFAGETDPTDNITDPKKRAEQLEKLKARWDVEAKDIKIINGVTDHLEYLLPDELAERISDSTGVRYLGHTIHNGLNDALRAEADANNTSISGMPMEDKVRIVTESIANLLASGGLRSSVIRNTEGIPVRGWSAMDDIGTGGADYVFLNPLATEGSYTLTGDGSSPTEIEFIWKAHDILKNMSIFANDGDEFGAREHTHSIVSELGPNSAELMVKHSVGFDNLHFLAVGRAVREPLIELLKQLGVNELGGKSLEEAIIVIGDNQRKEFEGKEGLNTDQIEKVNEMLSDAGIEGLDYFTYTEAVKNSFKDKFPNGFMPAPAGTKVIAATDIMHTNMKTNDGLIVQEPSGQFYLYYATSIGYGMKPELIYSDDVFEIVEGLSKTSKKNNNIAKPGKETPNIPVGYGAKTTYIIGLENPNYPVETEFGLYGPPTEETIISLYDAFVTGLINPSVLLSVLSAYLGVKIPIEVRAVLIDIIIAVQENNTEWKKTSAIYKNIPPDFSANSFDSTESQAMTAAAEESPVLPMSSLDEKIKTRSYINDYVLLENMSGSNRGATRRVSHIEVMDQGNHSGKNVLYVPTEENVLILPLDENVPIRFDPKYRFGTFTSRGVKYRIKPIPAVKNQTKPAQSSEPADGR